MKNKININTIQYYFKYNLLNKKYKDNRNVKIIDMRTIFLDRYKELYYDECHFYGKGNLEKANLIYKAISELFFETGSSK